MFALMNSLKVPVSTHDVLVRNRVRLLDSRDKMSRFIGSLREIRNTLNDAYRETKGLKMPWTRFRLMNSMIKETLGAFEQIQTLKNLHDREEILLKHGISESLGDDQELDICGTNDEVFENGIELANRELQCEIERLRIETARLQEVYTYEAQVFEALGREYKSLWKYRVFQRYIIIKLIIKIAAKSDL